ncbi:MAG: hypothetical protein E7Z89_04975 [Cyanobacteria bacterium SIG28]|nr:hypothetical protein [Cyanobacteria bacterium SIG28]
MKNLFINLLLIVLAGFCAWYSYTNLSGIYSQAGFFVSGLLTGIFLMNLKLNVKNDRITSYQRQLEKEAISSDENSAKVKVLEQKIEVLEKALENALNK